MLLNYFLKNGSPSQVALYQHKRPKEDAPSSVQQLFTDLAPGYTRMLDLSRKSTDLSHVKKALDIAIGLSFAPSKHALPILTKHLNNHLELMIALFVRILATDGYTDAVIQLFNHLLIFAVGYTITKESQNPDNLDLCHIQAEQFELITSPICNRRFYQYLLPPEIPSTPSERRSVLTSRASIVKTIEQLLPSERAFLQFTQYLIQEALSRAKEKSAPVFIRVRLLDFALHNIRTLLDLYPCTPCIPRMLQMLEACVQSADGTLFEAHQAIVETLKRQVNPSSRIQNLKELARIAERISDYCKNPQNCSVHDIVDLQHAIFDWQENHFSGEYKQLFQCNDMLLNLIKIKDFIEKSEIHEMMETLLIPHLKCFGVNGGEPGKKYAFTSCLQYTIYLRESSTLTNMHFLKNAQNGGAFDHLYTAFYDLVIAIIPDFFEKTSKLKTEEQKQYITFFTTLVCSPVKTDEERRMKNKLVEYWIQYPKHDKETRLQVLQELIELKAPKDFLDEDAQLAKLLFSFIMIQKESIRTGLSNAYKQQASRFTFLNSSDKTPVGATRK